MKHGPTLAAALSCTITMILFYILSNRTVTISFDSTEQAANSFYKSQCSSYVKKALPYSTMYFPRNDMVCCMYSDRLRFIYLKVAKSAGSTVALGWLRSSLCPATNNDSINGYGNTTYASSCAHDLLYPPPSKGDCIDCSTVPMWKFRSYFVFTTVRSPWTRMISSYNYCNVFTNTGLVWSDWCTQPEMAGGCVANKSSPSIPNVHYQYPIHFAYHDIYGWYVDYIIRVENITYGLRKAAEIINSRRPVGESLKIPSFDNAPHINPSSHTKEQCAYYTGLNSVCKDFLLSTLDPQVLCYDDPCSKYASGEAR